MDDALLTGNEEELKETEEASESWETESLSESSSLESSSEESSEELPSVIYSVVYDDTWEINDYMTSGFVGVGVGFVAALGVGLFCLLLSSLWSISKKIVSSD